MPRVLQILALSYVLKTLLLGMAWLVIPDLPQRLARSASSCWTYLKAPRPKPYSPTTSRPRSTSAAVPVSKQQ